MMIKKEEVSKERGDNYGSFAEMSELAQNLKKHLVTPQMSSVQRESMEMICTKLARIATGNPNHVDSWFDISGYSDLVVKHLTEDNPIPGSWVPVKKP